MQSDLQKRLHIAIIMDGNGRWATQRGLPRQAGHKAGVDALRRISEAAWDLGAGTLTVYAFSSDNWRRPPAEVSALMGLLRRYLATEIERLAKSGIRLSVIGRRDRLPNGIAQLIAQAEAATANGKSLHLRIALDYSGRDAILQAVSAAQRSGGCSRETMAEMLGGKDCSDVDLLIRTSGEQRLSDFLLWECAYAELHFTQRHWPDFEAADLAAAIDAFRRRDRRYGGISAAAIAV
ncbi:MAG: di-trans,poly-cis-decaprenylcistransferase [Rhodomicrobium sp.]